MQKTYFNCTIIFFSKLQFPSELNPWKFLQTHILSDYMNHEVIDYHVIYFLIRNILLFALHGIVLISKINEGVNRKLKSMVKCSRD